MKKICQHRTSAFHIKVPSDKVMKSLKNTLSNMLPNRIKPRFIYKGTKIGSFFSVKDKIDKAHRSDLVYGYTEKEESDLGYVGETNVRIERREQEHAKWDTSSAIYKNSVEKKISVTSDDFKVLESGYPKSIDRKIAEALYIKDFRPVLNGQKVSYKLKLFN